jgi:4-hydroxy-tetrahydrodipicolinate reductase
MRWFKRTKPSPIRLLHVGLGPIGAAIVRQAAERPGLRIVGAVDIDPAKVGRDLGEVAGLGRKLRVVVEADARRALRRARPHVVVLCTGSSLARVAPQIETILRAGASIVSTTEELAYPVGPNVRIARRLDALARRRKVAVLGTGVNPGFVMDALPLVLTAACERVSAVRVERVQDARLRRLPFQQKIGAGLSRDEFERRVREGGVRHVGLAESIAMIAAGLGWKLERVTDEIRPRLADERVASDYLTVEPGQVCGIVQEGIGYREGRPAIVLRLEAYLGAPESYDAVTIDAVPPIAMRIQGGLHGDVATASIVVNSIPKVAAAPPGLHTMRSLPLPSYFGGLR